MQIKAPLQINIPRRSQCCEHGKEPLLPGCEYFSLLLEGLTEGSYTRQDYCPDCWKACTEQKTLPHACSTWKAVVPAKKEPSDLPKQRDARALIILKDLLERDESHSYPEAFVLSLYLARRRRLYLRQELMLNDGHPASLYEVPDTEEMLCVRRLVLSSLEVEKIQQTLAAKFRI